MYFTSVFNKAHRQHLEKVGTIKNEDWLRQLAQLDFFADSGASC